MKTRADIEQTLLQFFREFMNLRPASSDDVSTALSSMQQFELLMFVEQELGTDLDLSDLQGATVGTLSDRIARGSQA